MTGRDEIGRRPGPVATLFVLFGLLFNVAAATGTQLDRDPRAARLGNGEIVRAAPGARLASRSDDDGAGQDKALASLPPEPVALAAFSYPAGGSRAFHAASAPRELPAPYRARAPPAA